MDQFSGGRSHFLQLSRLLWLNAAVLVAPAVKGLYAHAVALEKLRHRAARLEHGVGLATRVDDLLGVCCARFAKSLPDPSGTGQDLCRG